MDFDKLKEACTKIKMPSDMKKRIADNCNAAEVPQTLEKPQRRLDGRLIAACACCFLLLLGIGLTYSGIFEKKPPISSEVTAFSDTSEESRLLEILSTAKSTAAQIFETTKDNISESETEVKTQLQSQQEVENTASESTAEFTTSPFIFPNGDHAANTGSDDNVQSAQPCTLYMEDVKKLKAAKKAAETMSEEEFDAFLDENGYWETGMGCFASPQEYLAFTQSNVYIPVVEENAAEIYLMYYVPLYECIDVGFSFSDTDRIRFYIDTTGETDFCYKDSDRYRYVKTIQKGNATWEIYSLKWWYKDGSAWEGYGIDITVDGQEMSAVTNDEISMEELEKYIGLIEFVTIKDWLS